MAAKCNGLKVIYFQYEFATMTATPTICRPLTSTETAVAFGLNLPT
jgi:hypothetical protein